MPSCFAVWRFPPTFRMCKQAPDVSYLLFSYSSISREPLCSLQPDSQWAAVGNSTASQKMVHHLQNTLVCTHLPPLTGEVGNKDPTQPSGLTSIHPPHCCGDGKMAPRPFPARPAYPALRVPVHSSVSKLRKALLTLPKLYDILPHAGYSAFKASVLNVCWHSRGSYAQLLAQVHTHCCRATATVHSPRHRVLLGKHLLVCCGNRYQDASTSFGCNSNHITLLLLLGML